LFFFFPAVYGGVLCCPAVISPTGKRSCESQLHLNNSWSG